MSEVIVYPLAFVTVLAGLAANHSGDILLVVGVVVFAIATLRSRSPEILRRENADLRERNAALEERVKKIPRLEEQIAVLEGRDVGALYDLMQDHDKRMMAAAERIADTLREIHVAVVPPRIIIDNS